MDKDREGGIVEAFWKPKPRAPWADWRTYSMMLPIVVSAAGFFGSGIFAFAFSDIDVIPDNTQSWLVIISSAMIVLGAEANTPGTTIEVFRKLLRKEHNTWDVSALIVSLVGTMVNLLVTFASRTKISPVWREVVLVWGPLLSGFAVACDYYGGLVETGFLFGSYEMRMEQWLEERRDFDRENNVTPPSTEDKVVFDPSWPQATSEDAQRIFSALNGQRTEWSKAELRAFLERKLAEEELRPRTEGTTYKWIAKAQRG